MTSNRAFRLTFTVALVLAVIQCVVPFTSPLRRVFFYASDLALLALGVLIGRIGGSLSSALVRALPFVFLLFATYAVQFALYGPSAVAPGVAPEQLHNALLGVLLVSPLVALMSLGLCALGFLAGRLTRRYFNAPQEAA